VVTSVSRDLEELRDLLDVDSAPDAVDRAFRGEAHDVVQRSSRLLADAHRCGQETLAALSGLLSQVGEHAVVVRNLLAELDAGPAPEPDHRRARAPRPHSSTATAAASIRRGTRRALDEAAVAAPESG
jgi:hypothetical protein